MSGAMLPRARPGRVVIEGVAPVVDCGRHPVKRVLGDRIDVEADCFAEGHDLLAVTLRYRHDGDKAWQSVPMQPLDNDRWRASFGVDRLGLWRFGIEARVDAPASLRGGKTRSVEDFRVSVERQRARFSTWYELFPRSCAGAAAHGTFADLIGRLDYVAAMGFDVLYLPPIHPIGRVRRKGRNNSTVSTAEDVGSPWAIGAEEGGHKAIHPQLGNRDDFRALLAAARERGLEVALDIAFQCAPDHPYVAAHRAWFRSNPDGSIRCAENPPKKYEDIYPFDFESEDWRALWLELESVIEHWIGEGIVLFRVDNPHTKPFAFWEWALAEVKRRHPEVLFLSEAFTRPKVMHRLAKIGFSQSYTYFTWRETKQELTEYFTELAHGPGREYFRPNCWPNTPDILPRHLHGATAAAFRVRLVLAATLAANYGIYGPAFELMENVPREAGGEEYRNSEKYQLRAWDTSRADSLAPFIARINRIRREHRALQADWSLRFHSTDSDRLLCYSKTGDDGDRVLSVVNLDPLYPQSGWVTLDLETLEIADGAAFAVDDLLSGERYEWKGPRNFVRLDPAVSPAHVFHLPGAAA